MFYFSLVIVSSILTMTRAGHGVSINQDWWESGLFYQIFVRSFMDSDGDGIGDLNGITMRLEHLKELGIDAAILSPIFKSPIQDFGFAISDFYAVQNEYGTVDDLEQLVRKALDFNIKVVLDLVPNHTSNESDWFIKSVARDEYYSDWYVWESGHIDERGNKKPPNNWISAYQKSAWTYSPVRDQYYLHQFGVSQPDLNYRNPVVSDEMKNIFKFWLEKGVAGFRMQQVNFLFETDKETFGGMYPDEPLTGKPGLSPDDYGYLDHIYTRDQDETYDMVSQWREVFEGITVRDNITRIIITEAHTNIQHAVKYYGDGFRGCSHIPQNLFLIQNLNKEIDVRDLKHGMDRWLTYKPLNKPANWMSGNYHISRVASRFRRELVDAFNMLVLLAPGAAISYMGEEIGMIDGYVSWTDTRDPKACNTDDPMNYVDVSSDPARTPFQWSAKTNAGFSSASNTWIPLAEGFDVVNVAIQRSAERSHYQTYRTLMALRRRPAFRFGRYESVILNNGVYAFKRWYTDDTYVIVMNLGKNYQVVNLTAFDLIFGTLEVEARSVLSTRSLTDTVQAQYLDLAADEALVLRMQV